ncbi:phosphate butyryltransferase [Peribacillus deserti]|uniref:Phosphate butyryltransferase n=1 Tax=Peribacillus deserti TaxID=673318 RepID=A0ABS2QJG2_9BACI|nr:phosphate butyryltransferase [Peribacillus deserti]MBM7693237.1 phosphate butyryltransferase [Peribacillus deserti]
MNLEVLLEKAARMSDMTVAVAAADDGEVIDAVAAAIEQRLARFHLFGNSDKIEHLLESKQKGLSEHSSIDIYHAASIEKAAELAVQSVRLNEASVLMKGNISTAVILKAVLNKEAGLRTENMLSHVAAFQIPGQTRMIFITDAAMNISPDLTAKADIIKNAVAIARSIGIEMPKVAALAAVEVVNPKMPATVDGALLAQMNRRGQIKDCIVDGPLALDIAISAAAAEHKGIQSEAAGMADILLVPNIETGNSLYKSLVYFAGAKVGAVIAGARAPIVLTSRSDSAESKLFSLALAICSVSNDKINPHT